MYVGSKLNILLPPLMWWAAAKTMHKLRLTDQLVSGRHLWKPCYEDRPLITLVTFNTFNTFNTLITLLNNSRNNIAMVMKPIYMDLENRARSRSPRKNIAMVTTSCSRDPKPPSWETLCSDLLPGTGNQNLASRLLGLDTRSRLLGPDYLD